MSSTRLSYDGCDTDSDIKKNLNQLNYHLFTAKYNHHNTCSSKNLTCNLNDGKRTEIENDLLQLDNKNSNCNKKKYQSPCNNPTECVISNNNFTPMRILDRDIVWTNIQKPSNNGLPKMN